MSKEAFKQLIKEAIMKDYEARLDVEFLKHGVLI